jgi:hypothetical protein
VTRFGCAQHWFGKKMADILHHHHLYYDCAVVHGSTLYIGNRINKEQLIIGLATVPAEEFQTPVLR